MRTKDINSPTVPGRGIGFVNHSKLAPTHPDIVCKVMMEDGKIIELVLFAKGTDGSLWNMPKAKFFGISANYVEQETSKLPELPEGDYDDGKVSFRG